MKKQVSRNWLSEEYYIFPQGRQLKGLTSQLNGLRCLLWVCM